MTEKNLFIKTLFLVIAIIFSAISQCSAVLSDKRLCYDPNCSGNWSHTLFSICIYFKICFFFNTYKLFNDIFSVEPISLARTTIKYFPNESGLLSFNVNDKVTVYSKEAGKRDDLWGVEVNFINFNFFNFTSYQFLSIFIIYIVIWSYVTKIKIGTFLIEL